MVFLSLRFMPVRHARFHWTSKFADNDVFGGFFDENDVGFFSISGLDSKLNRNFVVSVGSRAGSAIS